MKAIVLADLHLRSTIPSCIEATQTEWIDTQYKALDKVANYAIEKQVTDVLIGGDIFHSEQTTSFQIINLFQEFCKNLEAVGITVWILAGNHDLLQHSSQNINKSAIGVILNSQSVYNMKYHPLVGCGNFDEDTPNEEIIFKHVLCIPKNQIPPFIECETPETLLNKYDKAKWIFTGDYHKSFSYIDNHRFVLNSGCLTKQAADFENYETGCWYVDTDDESFEWCPIDISQRFYRNAEKIIDKDIEAFANSVKKESITLDYIQSVRNEIINHEKPIQDKVNSWINEIGQ